MKMFCKRELAGKKGHRYLRSKEVVQKQYKERAGREASVPAAYLASVPAGLAVVLTFSVVSFLEAMAAGCGRRGLGARPLPRPGPPGRNPSQVRASGALQRRRGAARPRGGQSACFGGDLRSGALQLCARSDAAAREESAMAPS